VDHTLVLKVVDFGVGFDADATERQPGLGMISMQERARSTGGTFDIDSELGSGTAITVKVPLEQP
jgi:two-component system NarL family sensor kinase